MIRLLMICAFLFSQPLCAGLWDSDRPDEPSPVYDIIGGRFDVYPDAYYQQRLERVLPVLSALDSLEVTADDAQIEQIAQAAPLFDQAAVAHFRAGRYAEAIILIDRKNRLLALIQHDRTATASQHRTRALANKAACLHHRWLGDQRSISNDLERAAEILRGLVTEDMYNTDAAWSLREIEWLLGKPAYAAGVDPVFPNMLGLKDASFRGELNHTALVGSGLGGSVPWLARRIAYEEGWHDVDLMYALSLVLYLSGLSEESLFAWFRVCELIDDGHTTRVANAPGPNALKRLLGVHLEQVKEQDAARELYRELRDACERWRTSRNKFLLARMQEGQHPDTTEDFWASWKLIEDTPPEPGRPEPDDSVNVSRILLLGGFGGLILVLVLIFGAAMFMSRKGPAPSVDEL